MTEYTTHVMRITGSQVHRHDHASGIGHGVDRMALVKVKTPHDSFMR